MLEKAKVQGTKTSGRQIVYECPLTRAALITCVKDWDKRYLELEKRLSNKSAFNVVSALLHYNDEIASKLLISNWESENVTKEL